MRVLVLSSLYRHPAPRSKLRALAELGVEVIAAIPDGDSGIDAGVRLAPIPVEGNLDASDRIRWHAPSVKRLVAEVHPELIQVEEDPASDLAGTIARIGRRAAIPFVAFSWRSQPIPLGPFARRRLERVLGSAAGLIGGNERAAEYLNTLAPDSLVAAIPETGVTVPAHTSRSDGGQLSIGFVGRLSPERGGTSLIQALSQTFGHWRLTIAGTGPEQEQMEELVARHGLASRIRWLGGIRRETLEDTWPELDCLVMPWEVGAPSLEPHPSILLEAMARGITPLVTRAGALPELVGDAGVVVDDRAALTDALQAWVADPARCRRLGRRARERVTDRYADAAVAARTLEFWRAVLSRQPQ